MTLASDIRQKQAEEAAERMTGIKPMGNMMWFMDKEQAPRQLTKAERILWKALVTTLEEHM